MTKSIGQVLYEADDSNAYGWDELEDNYKATCECMACAVAAVVREQCINACHDERLPTQPPTYDTDSAYEDAVQDCIKAIRRMGR